MVVNDELIINKRKRAELEEELEENEFKKMGNNESYDYLLGMPIYQLTQEKIDELKNQEKEKNAEYKSLNELTAEDIWKHELVELKSSLEMSSNQNSNQNLNQNSKQSSTQSSKQSSKQSASNVKPKQK